MAYDSGNQKTILFGGSYSPVNNETWSWNGTNWSFKLPATSPSARSSHAMIYDENLQKVVLFGGNNGSYLQDTWTWDGTNWTQQSPTLSPSARSNHAMAYNAVAQLHSSSEAQILPLLTFTTTPGSMARLQPRPLFLLEPLLLQQLLPQLLIQHDQPWYVLTETEAPL